MSDTDSGHVHPPGESCPSSERYHHLGDTLTESSKGHSTNSITSGWWGTWQGQWITWAWVHFQIAFAMKWVPWSEAMLFWEPFPQTPFSHPGPSSALEKLSLPDYFPFIPICLMAGAMWWFVFASSWKPISGTLLLDHQNANKLW